MGEQFLGSYDFVPTIWIKCRGFGGRGFAECYGVAMVRTLCGPGPSIAAKHPPMSPRFIVRARSKLLLGVCTLAIFSKIANSFQGVLAAGEFLSQEDVDVGVLAANSKMFSSSDALLDPP